MKTDKLIAVTLLFSIFLYAEPIKKDNPFDTLPIKAEIKKDNLAEIQQDNNTSNISQKVQTNLELKFKKKRTFLLKDITHKRFLKKFYHQNNYIPLWFDAKGINKKVSSLFNEIENDITLDRDGKIYKRYLFVKNYLKNKERNNLHTELYLTALYIDFLNFRIYGLIKWKSFALQLKYLRQRGTSANWVTYKPDYNISELLLKPNIKETIDEVTPKRFGYNKLLKALKKLQELKKKGGWEMLPKFKKLELGDTGLIVLKLRERLVASGDLTSCESTAINLFEAEDKSEESDIKIQPEATFDKCLEDAVKGFQARHGLEADGIVGKGTRKILNMSVDDKIEKILLNIDRVKWLPREDNKRYIVVNIPEFMLHYIEDGVEKQTIPVIVGKKRHNTPIFNGEISYIVLNPYWKVPDGIVRKEIIPHMIKNPRYLKKEGLEIHTTWYEKSPKINPYSLYWEDYYNGYMKFPYRIMQPPGPKNALGKIKFKFPNRFNVYLHDTPTKRLFQKTKRAFSHGCIRVSKPVELFETIASFNNIDLNKSKKILKSKNKVQINIENRVPVYIIYLTAWYNEKTKKVEFRDDIYGYDKIQKRTK
jgi:murein L,D-transpeptidase YcbB/YkuD